jgi:hypothetical protein
MRVSWFVVVQKRSVWQEARYGYNNQTFRRVIRAANDVTGASTQNWLTNSLLH